MVINNAVIICYGGINVQSQNQRFTINFPISFTNTEYCIVFSTIRQQSTSEWFNTYSRTINSTVIYSYALVGQKYWVCIGY